MRHPIPYISNLPDAYVDIFQSRNELSKLKSAKGKFAGVCLTSGSAGTLGSGDYLKDQYPHAKIAVGEALQCPTLLNNGFGDHMLIAIDDNDNLEMEAERGKVYSFMDAAIDHNRCVLGVRTDSMEELTYQSKKRIHNLKYYTWIEQQEYDLNAQWYEFRAHLMQLAPVFIIIDKLIEQFNERTVCQANNNISLHPVSH